MYKYPKAQSHIDITQFGFVSHGGSRPRGSRQDNFVNIGAPDLNTFDILFFQKLFFVGIIRHDTTSEFIYQKSNLIKINSTTMFNNKNTLNLHFASNCLTISNDKLWSIK